MRAEASMLEQHQNIANEELRINQLKERLALDTQLGKLEAEDRVYFEFRMSSGSRCEGEFDEAAGSYITRNVIAAPLQMSQTKSVVPKIFPTLAMSDTCQKQAVVF